MCQGMGKVKPRFVAEQSEEPDRNMSIKERIRQPDIKILQKMFHAECQRSQKVVEATLVCNFTPELIQSHPWWLQVRVR